MEDSLCKNIFYIKENSKKKKESLHQCINLFYFRFFTLYLTIKTLMKKLYFINISEKSLIKNYFISFDIDLKTVY